MPHADTRTPLHGPTGGVPPDKALSDREWKGCRHLGTKANWGTRQGGTCAPTKVSIIVVEIGDHEAVEVREVVVDPLLPCLDIGGEVARQPLHRVNEARRADLGVQRGVAHRSARR
eukprot:scaffold7438_cov130-Isochrysis_galbana.AAC.2